VAVTALFAVLAVAAWFAFTARSVELNFEPRAESVAVVGTLFRLNVGDRFLLRSGTHRVVAERDGYYPIDQLVTVGRSADQTIQLEFTRLPGLLTVALEPAVEAEVWLGDNLLGRTPVSDVEVPPGDHRLSVRADRYLPAEQDLSVEGGGLAQAVALQLTPDWAPVSLTTEPAGAEVRVDGETLGTTPLQMELVAGRHDVEVRLRGYNAWRGNVEVEPDVPQTLPVVRLVQADGQVQLVSTPSDAAVSVNGEFRGRTPLQLTLSPGREHRVTLTRPGYDTVTRTLSVAADSGRRVEIDLPVQLGEVEVVSTPAQAEVWVNGTRLGSTPGRFELMAVEQQLEVRQPGFAAKVMPVTPRPGFPQRLEVELESLDPASGGGYAQTIRTGLGQELRLVPAGEFMMGSSRREQGRRSNEVLRPISISRAFYLGAREVTNAEFRAWRESHDSGSFSDHTLNDDNQPVVRVNWDEVVQYLNWLSVQDRLQPVYENRDGVWVARRPLRNGYRLPTEAEWEWAARAAGRETPLVYPWGDELPPPDRSGNFADVSAARVLPTSLVTYSDGFPVSAPVGSFPANVLGIMDLGGNVAEWVQDYYSIETTTPTETVIDPLGPETGRYHVVRGQSWRSATITDLRLAYRDYASEGREDIGFRIARNLE
jgi:formylglycine-generating enzyme required for sulfatase activity